MEIKEGWILSLLINHGVSKKKEYLGFIKVEIQSPDSSRWGTLEQGIVRREAV